MRISRLIPIAYGIVILTNRVIATNRKLIRAMVREMKREDQPMRTR